MIIATDLADLAWVRVETPTFGELAIPACSGDFLDWARSGLEAACWPDGPSLVRDLLATQARPQRDAEPLGEDAANRLTPADLHHFADAFLASTGSYLRPRTVAEGKGIERKIRKRRDDEANGLEAREGEGAASRLKRVLEAWIQDRADFNAMIASRIGLPTAELANADRAASGITRLLENHARLARIADPFPGLSAAMKALEMPGYSAALAAALRPSPAMEATQGMMKPPSRILVQIEAQQARMTEITRMATLPTTDLLAGLKLYPNLATDLASRLGVTDMTRTAKALAASLSLPSAADMIGLTALSNQAALAKAIGRQFDLRLPAATLAAMGALTATSALADAVRAQSFFPPGFQMAAVLGLENGVARGLVADVLHHYDEVALDAPAFAEALNSTAIVDAAVLTDAEAVSFLQRVAGWILSTIDNERDVIRRAGLIGVLTFVIGVIGIYIGHEALEVAKAGTTHADMTTLIHETQATRTAIQAEARGDSKAHDRIRYLHERANLRAEPQARGLVLRLIYPDQLLRIVEEKGDWVEGGVRLPKRQAHARLGQPSPAAPGAAALIRQRAAEGDLRPSPLPHRQDRPATHVLKQTSS